MVGADLLLGQEAHVGLAQLDQPDGVGVHPREVVGRLVVVLAPVEAEPAHILGDGVDELLLFLGGVGVVEAQVAASAEFFRHAEIEADRLGVADMQVAVRLRRETRDDLGVALFGDVAGDDIADEIARGWWRGRRSVLSGHSEINCGARRGESTSQLEARA